MTSPGRTQGVPDRPARPTGFRRGRRGTGFLALRPTGILAVVAAVLVTATAFGALWAASDAPTPAYTGVVRQYYIAADPIAWNYTPSGMNEITGQPFGAGDGSDLLYTLHNATYLGPTLEKCGYVRYTNASFTTVMPRPASEAYLGLQGPTIYAVVGDIIEITFKNNCPTPESMHPHGVFYLKASEGAPSDRSSNGTGGDEVPTGTTWNYEWLVPDRAGPGPADGSSVMWMYHSHVYEPVDINTGLAGTILITSPTLANADGTPKDVDANIVLNMLIYDESVSTYASYNIAHYPMDPTAVNPDDPDWSESLLKYSINGYLYGNMPMITFRAGEHVRWYIMSYGGDFHTATWQGNPLLVMGQRTADIGLAPGAMAVGDMWPNSTGVWLFGSALAGDIAGGMQERYTVLDANATSAVLTGAPGPAAAGTPITPESAPLRLPAPSTPPEMVRWN